MSASPAHVTPIAHGSERSSSTASSRLVADPDVVSTCTVSLGQSRPVMGTAGSQVTAQPIPSSPPLAEPPARDACQRSARVASARARASAAPARHPEASAPSTSCSPWTAPTITNANVAASTITTRAASMA